MSSANTEKQGFAARPVRRPFWMPALSYYLLSSSASALIFVGVWALLTEGGDSAPAPVAAGVSAFVFLASVFLREVFLRRSYQRYLALRRRLEENISSKSVPPGWVQPGDTAPPKKLTLKQNGEIVARIKRKSDAAKVLMGVSNGHLEVAELCLEYLRLNKSQIESARWGSPRIGGLRESRTAVKKLHHFHLLSWAEIESKALTRSAADCDSIEGKVLQVRGALKVLEAALGHYPQDPALLDSRTAVSELLFSAEMSSRIELAEKEAFAGRYESAVRTLRGVLEHLDDEGVPKGDVSELRERLKSEIERFSAYSRRDASDIPTESEGD